MLPRLLIVTLAAAGCAHLPPAPGAIVGPGLPGNLHCFAHEQPDGLGKCVGYSSEQPTPAQLVRLRDQFSVGFVVKLDDPRIPFDGGPDRPPAGVVILPHPWLPQGPVSHEDMQLALDDLDMCISLARAPGASVACQVHCRWGKDRTYLLISVWRVRHGVAPAFAWGEWRAFPRSRTDGWLYDAFERETGYRIPDDER